MFFKELILFFPEKAAPIKDCLSQFERKFRDSGVEISQFWDFTNQDQLCDSSKEAKIPFDTNSSQVGGKVSGPQVQPAQKQINNIFTSSSNQNSIQFTLPPPMPIQNSLENGHLLSNKADKFENLNLSAFGNKNSAAIEQHKCEDPENGPLIGSSATELNVSAPIMSQSEQIDHLMTLPDLQQLYDALKNQVIQDDRRFLKFVSYYQQLPSTSSQLKEQVRRLELKCYAKEAELEERLNNQGFDTSRIEGLAKTPFKADEDIYGEGVRIIKKANGVSYLDPNMSVTQDIEGEGFSDFQEACWILLTTQKPGSVSPDAQMTKDQPKEKDQKSNGIQKSSVVQNNNIGPQRPSNESVEKDTSGSQDTIVASFAGPGGSLGKTNSTRPEGRTTTARAATLGGGQVNQNLNQLNQVQIVLPQKRYGHSASIIDNKLFIFGGAFRKGNGASPFHSFYECTLKLDAQRDELFKWKRIHGEAPRTRDSHSCVSFLDQLLIFGGSCDGECYNDLYKYNITNKIWTKLEPLADPNQAPSPREGHIAVMVGGGDKMLIHGGINDLQNCFDDAYILTGLHKQIDQQQSEVKTNQYGHIVNSQELKTRRGQFEVLRWFKCEQEGDIPSARDSHSATLANNQIYLFGGQDTEESLLNDFFKVSLSQGQVLTKQTDEAGLEHQFYDRTFKLIWTKIEVRDPLYGQNIPWPIKRSSHSMNLFMNRFLVLIGGETSTENTPSSSPKKPNNEPQAPKGLNLPENFLKNNAYEQVLDENIINVTNQIPAEKLEAEDEEKSSNANRPLNDVWLYDLMLNYWRQVEPVTKVQSSFNNKKLRKSFEPRMAHSASTLGNYIVVFGGYNSQTNQYSPANFSILSLAGCTDFILQKPCTLKMVQEEIIVKRQLLAVQLQKKVSKSKKTMSKPESKKENKKELTSSSNIRIQLDDDDFAQQMMENLQDIDAPRNCLSSAQRNGVESEIKDTKIIIESNPLLSKNNAKSFQYKQPNAISKILPNSKGNIKYADAHSQATEQPDPKHKKRGLMRKFKNNRIEFLSVKKLAEQIKRPIQLIAEILKGQISLYERHHQLHERGDSKKQVLNRDNFEELDIWVQLLFLSQPSHKKLRQDINILLFKDNGPGFSHSNLREALTGEIPQFSKYSEGLESETVHYFEYFKYAALKLANHALVITRTVQLNRNSLQLKKDEERFQEEVHIGMLSGNFVKDSGSTHIVAPIISFKVQMRIDGQANKDGEYFDLVPLTPLPDKFIGLILEYTGNIFESVQDLKEHIKKDVFGPKMSFQTGTEIYLCGLKQSYNSCDGDIVLVNEVKRATLATMSQQEEEFTDDIVHSLATQMQYAFIDFPQHVNLSINSKKISARNPFGDILQFVAQGEDVAIRGESKDFRYWVISEPKLRSLGVQDGLLQKFEGLLIYRGNDFVRAFDECQPSGNYQQSTGLKSSLGKRIQTFDQQQSILHGIIMVNQELESASMTFDAQDLQSKILLDTIMSDVLLRYQQWAAKQFLPNQSDQVPSTTQEYLVQSSLDKQDNEPQRKIQKLEKPKEALSAQQNGQPRKLKISNNQEAIKSASVNVQKAKANLNGQQVMTQPDKQLQSDSSPDSKVQEEQPGFIVPTISQHQFELLTDQQQQEYLAQHIQMQQQFHMNHQMMADAQQHDIEQQIYMQQQHDLQIQQQQSYGNEQFDNQYHQQVAVAQHEAFRQQIEQQMMAENIQKDGAQQEGFDHDFELIENGQNQQPVVVQQYVDQFGNQYVQPQFIPHEDFSGQAQQLMDHQPQNQIQDK